MSAAAASRSRAWPRPSTSRRPGSTASPSESRASSCTPSTTSSFTIERGTTLALVGESGCGKSTVARLLVGLYAPTRGRVVFDGVDTVGTGGARPASIRRRMQMIFQDPYASLNPRWKVRDIVAEPLREHGFGDDGGGGGAATRAARDRSRRRAARRRSASRPPTPRSSRTSSPAASASASRSRARSPPSRSSWSATSRPRRSTSRCRRRSSTS